MTSFLLKQEIIKKDFNSCLEREALYERLMKWGEKLPPFPETEKREENRVLGCQSMMYLSTRKEGGFLHFDAYSDALISAGLAGLLLYLYSGETPETILTAPPTFLQDLGLLSHLTPGRANGLASLYVKIKQEALKCLVGSTP